MSKTAISWAEETLNPLVGCSPASKGCQKCYAALVAGDPKLQKFPQYKDLLTRSGKWNGNVNFVPKVLDKLVRMKKPRTIFMPSMSDPFHPNVKREWLDQIFAAIALVPHIEIMMLTKRAERMLEYFSDPEALWERWLTNFLQKRTDLPPVQNDLVLRYAESDPGEPFPLPNLMLGVSVEDQETADERVPLLLKTPAAKRFLSVEPMLEAIDLSAESGMHNPGLGEGESWINPLGGRTFDSDGCGTNCAGIDLVICGGESGKEARLFDINWARSLRDQCMNLGWVRSISTGSSIPFHLKQLGSNPVDGANSIKAGFKGQNVSLWPEDLQKCHLGDQS